MCWFGKESLDLEVGWGTTEKEIYRLIMPNLQNSCLDIN